MRPRIIAASAREDGDFRDLLARNSLPKAPMILDKKKLKNFKPPSSGRGGDAATLDQYSVTKQQLSSLMSPTTTSTYERGLKVTSVAPINLNPKLDKLLKLNQAYKGNGSKMEGSQYLDETIKSNTQKKR